MKSPVYFGHLMPEDESALERMIERMREQVAALEDGSSFTLRVSRVPVKGRTRGPIKGQLELPKIEIGP